MLKKFIIAMAAVVMLFILAVAAAVIFTPTHCQVEREVTINKPREEVFDYVKQLKAQKEWGPWFKKEPSMKQDFRGTDGEVGFISHWKGENPDVGEGEQEIKRIIPNERVETELRFIEPFESKADAYLTTEPAGEGQTKVKWGFSTEMPRPMNVMLLFVSMDEMVGPDFESGLAGLKTILESR